MIEQSLALRGGSSIAPPWREREHVMCIGITSASQRDSVAAHIVTRIVCARAKVHVLGRLVTKKKKKKKARHAEVVAAILPA
jgi:hypothetical protein